MVTTPAQSQQVPVPSGLVTALFETLIDVKPDGELTYARFRFVTSGLGGDDGAAYDAVRLDFAVLCQEVALPQIATWADPVDRVVISLSDRITEFGVSDPDATQYFEMFRVQGDTCIWEEF